MRQFFITILIIFMPIAGLSDKGIKDQPEKLYFNDDFFKEYINIPEVMRDEFWKEKLNYIITARGTVTDIKTSNRYKKKYCIIIKDNDSGRYNQSFIYQVYIENQDSYEMLSVNEIFEFSGQLVAFTPLSVDRGEYIFDILIEKGAILVK